MDQILVVKSEMKAPASAAMLQNSCTFLTWLLSRHSETVATNDNNNSPDRLDGA
jgi:hypothetical protein